RSHSQPPDTIADVREPPGPHPAAFRLWNSRRAVVKSAGGGAAPGRAGTWLGFYPGRTKLRPFPPKPESRGQGWGPATGSPPRERRGVPLAGTSGGGNLKTHIHTDLRWTVGTRFATGRSPCGATAAGVSGA